MQTHKEVTVMSTRSFICKYDADKKAYRAIYCHFDGYVEGVGALLDANYNTESKVDALLDLGDISFLEATVEKTRKNVYKNFQPRYLTHITDNEEVTNSGIEFVYLYVSKGLWQVYMVDSQTWDYVPDLLKDKGIPSHLASNGDTTLDDAENWDCYEQIRQAEREGRLADLLMDTLDNLSDSYYETFKKTWSEVWASHVSCKK